ncbi:rich repeat and nacht domain-containing protein [Anaeramoeba flamelloides]|uniref:Rich repeat and nacht domain-containing protein n=1 Tax=Anaeramoeba flamelloides TaxID=1746091 RepID=A0ABQ8XP28_9EUKA|nr:rich repeat and nacht domain-containing protein [Anaeramoeba flamelloides]
MELYQNSSLNSQSTRELTYEEEDFLITIDQLKQNNCSLTSLRLQGLYLPVNCTEVINEMLLTNTTLKTLDLSKNYLSIDHLQSLEEGFCSNASLNNLDFSSNPLEGDCYKYLSNILHSKFNRLTKLKLCWMEFCEKDFNLLCGSVCWSNTLVVLDLSHSVYPEKGFTSLAAILTPRLQLKSQNQNLIKNENENENENEIENEIENENRNRNSAYNPILKKLKLSHPPSQSTPPTIESFNNFCKSLGQNTSLQYLELKNLELNQDYSDSLYRAISKNRSINTLDLSWNDLNCAAIKKICTAIKDSHSKQQWLNQRIRPLTALDLSGNRIGTIGTFELGKLIKEDNYLQSLKLSYVPSLHSTPLPLAYLLSEIKKSTTIKKFAIHTRVFHDPKNSTTNLSNFNFGNTDNLKKNNLQKVKIEELKEIKEYSNEIKQIQTRKALGTVLVETISSHQFLKTLDLSFCRIGHKSFKLLLIGFRNNTSLTHLDLSWSHVRPNDFGIWIAELIKFGPSSLVSFNCDGNNLDSTDITALCESISTAENCNLKELSLANNNIDKLGANVFSQLLNSNFDLNEIEEDQKKLTQEEEEEEEEDDDDNDDEEDESGEEFEEMGGFENDEYQQFNKFSTTQNDEIFDQDQDYYESVSNYNCQLKKLNLSSNYLEYGGLISICKSLKDNTVLQELDISSNILRSAQSIENDLKVWKVIGNILEKNFILNKLIFDSEERQQIIAFQILKKLARNEQIAKNNLIFDFKNLFIERICTDCEIGEIPIHNLMIELRTKEKFSNIKEFLEGNYNREVIRMFLFWIYTSISVNEKIILNLANTLQINNILNQSLEKDLLIAWNNKESKDFKIICFTGEEIYVHKVVLIARSGLYRMLLQSMKNDVNEIKDYSRKSYISLSVLIYHFYFEEIDIEIPEKEIPIVIEELSDAVEFFQLNPNSSLHGFLKNLKFQY